MKNRRNFRILRFCFYVLAFIYLLISEVKEDYSLVICPSKGLFDIDCYLCGMTRAFISMFHLKINEAISLNPIVIALYPLFVFTAIQDTFIFIKDLLLKKESNSFLEFLINKIC